MISMRMYRSFSLRLVPRFGDGICIIDLALYLYGIFGGGGGGGGAKVYHHFT